MKQASEESIDDDFAMACFLIEKKLGIEIHPDYPAAKFVVQLEQMKKYYEEQEKEMDRTKSRGTF